MTVSTWESVLLTRSTSPSISRTTAGFWVRSWKVVNGIRSSWANFVTLSSSMRISATRYFRVSPMTTASWM